MLKVLHIEITKNRGGIESFLLNIYKNMNKENIKFGFVTKDKNISYVYDINCLGGEVYYVCSKKNIVLYIMKMYSIIRKYDIIHIHKNSLANSIPIYLALLSSKKIIVHSHNTAPKVNNVFVRLLHALNREIVSILNVKRISCSLLAGQWLFEKKKFRNSKKWYRLFFI